jgi:hypothetical protein
MWLLIRAGPWNGSNGRMLELGEAFRDGIRAGFVSHIEQMFFVHTNMPRVPTCKEVILRAELSYATLSELC